VYTVIKRFRRKRLCRFGRYTRRNPTTNSVCCSILPQIFYVGAPLIYVSEQHIADMNMLATSMARPAMLTSFTCIKNSCRTVYTYGDQQYPAAIIPRFAEYVVASPRCFSTAKTSKKGKKGENQGDSSTATEPSYFERKAALKQQRVQYYQQKLQRTAQLKHRRDGAPKDVLKNEFVSWWDRRRIYEEKMERKARQAGMEWKIQVATIVERLPIVLPDKMDFESDFEDLQAYLKSHTGKNYPVEFTGTSGTDQPVALTDEELLGKWEAMISGVSQTLAIVQIVFCSHTFPVSQILFYALSSFVDSPSS
jgi:hypothetical protein